jgi:DNA-binding IclR family transcriptional regulator
MTSEQRGRRIESVDTSLQIIKALRELRGATVSELSAAVDVTPGTIHTHLQTLADHGLVVQEGKSYELGLHMVTLGEYVKHQNSLYQGAKQQVDKLAAETGECIHLFTRHGDKGFIIYESYGKQAVGSRLHQRLREESYQHLHCSAGGKAMLAHMDRGDVDDILNQYSIERMTPKTITDREQLLEDLETVKDRGYALNDEELVRGQRAVGVAVLDAEENPLGAISLSAPRSRLEGDRFHETIPELLLEAVNFVELNIHTDQIEL